MLARVTEAFILHRMYWHSWLAFAVASFVLGIVPGPGVTSIVGHAVGSGRHTALASVAGLALGNMCAITLSLAGVGAVLAASPLAFRVLTWAGAGYLVLLGVRTLSAARAGEAGAVLAVPPRQAFLAAVTLGLFHPKTIVFFVAFVPQFIAAGRPYAPQAALLGCTFCGIILLTDSAYALAASAAAGWLRRPTTALWAARTSGAMLIAAGVAIAVFRA